jgi:YgiT-type zinc finger domain-containing protein
MKCTNCKNGIMKSDVSAYFGDYGSSYVIIENVPCYKCEMCGEIFYPFSVAEKIEEVLNQNKIVTSKVTVYNYINIT